MIGIRPEHLEDASLAADVPAGPAARRSGADRGARPELIYLKSDAAPAQTEEVKELARDGATEPQAVALSEDGGAT